MSDIVERLRLNASPLGEWGELADRLQIEAADTIERQDAEIERLRAERDTFYMDYRIKCDEETKRLEGELQNCRNKLKASGRAKLREELAAAKAVIENIVVSEVEPLKALLRTVLLVRDASPHLCQRIRAALGDEP